MHMSKQKGSAYIKERALRTMKIKTTIGHRPQSKHLRYSYRRIAIMAMIVALANLYEVTTVWGASSQSMDGDPLMNTTSAIVATKEVATKNGLSPQMIAGMDAPVDLIPKTERGQRFLAGPGIAIATTTSGQVQGYINNGIYTYHGIPYAETPRRFEQGHAVTPWQGIRLAVDYGPIAPQPKSDFPATTWEEPARAFATSETVQNLNIWTPGLDGAKRPVMVWLHGGGFSNGSSVESAAYDGGNLSRTGDVVVVSVNHRLNVLGYLDLSAYGKRYAYSGNIGTYDIVDALRWVHDNIASFGGDPNNVTIFGESGGGAKVLALMTTPYAKGLFQKGIVESGAVETMGPYFMPKAYAERVAALTLQNLGLDAAHIESIQQVPYDTLLQAANKAMKQVGEENKVPEALGSGYGLNWEPVIDGDFMPTNPVTDKGFAEAGKDIPLLIGSNRTEWTSFADIMGLPDSQYTSKNTWSSQEVTSRLKAAYGDKTQAVVKAFLNAYPNKTRADALYIDTMIRLPMLKIMSHKAAQGGAPVYAYMFTWDSPMMNGIYMSFHTAEIPFVFHNIDKMAFRIGGSDEAKQLETIMSHAWIQFARTGRPGGGLVPNWTPYTEDTGATMLFDTTVHEVYHHDRDLMNLLAPTYMYRVPAK